MTCLQHLRHRLSEMQWEMLMGATSSSILGALYATLNFSLRNDWEPLDIGEVDDGGGEYNPANPSLWLGGGGNN